MTPGPSFGRSAVDAGVGTAPALALRMNQIALGVKRSFHGFLRITRKPLASVGLTAARFDLLYAVRARGWPSSFVKGSVDVRQSDIRRVLGVTPTVVSRMVRSLETLGLVVRRRETEGDRRQMRVTLTMAGLKTLKSACRLLLKGVQRIVCEVICFGGHRDPWERLVAVETLEGYLRELRKHFGDSATLYYPWGHPDD